MSSQLYIVVDFNSLDELLDFMGKIDTHNIVSVDVFDDWWSVEFSM